MVVRQIHPVRYADMKMISCDFVVPVNLKNNITEFEVVWVTCVAPLVWRWLLVILALKCSTGWLWRMDDKRSAVVEMAVEPELVFMLIPDQILTGQSDCRYQLY